MPSVRRWEVEGRFGSKLTSRHLIAMSALPPKADIGRIVGKVFRGLGISQKFCKRSILEVTKILRGGLSPTIKILRGHCTNYPSCEFWPTPFNRSWLSKKTSALSAIRRPLDQARGVLLEIAQLGSEDRFLSFTSGRR